MNNDLISRSALLEKLSKINPIEQKHPLYFLWRHSLSVALREIKAAPAVDAVEVVRCGECEYLEGGECVNPYFVMSDGAHFYPENDFFCSRGERITE